MASNATGNAEIQVSTLVAEQMRDPKITLLPAGGWIAVWTADSEESGNEFTHTLFQRFDAAGNPVGAETQVGNPDEFFSDATVLPLSDGGWLVIHDGANIVQQRFDANGNAVGGETQINTVGGDLRGMVATVLENGGWVVGWNRNSFNEQVFQQVFDADGNAVGGEVKVNTTTSGRHFMSDIEALPDGGWVVVWEQGGGINSVKQQRFDANGAPVGGETQVNTSAGGPNSNPKVTALADGGWVVTWADPDGDQSGIFQQRYDSNGDAVGSQTGVNTTTASFQSEPDVTALPDGGWVVVWYSGGGQDGERTGVYMQRFDVNGDPIGTETLVNVTTAGDQIEPSVTALDGGGWVVTWVSIDPVTFDDVVMQRAFTIDVEGTDGADVLSGTALGEVLRGFRGDDTYIVNSALDDVIETRNQGTDTVRASIDYTLTDNVENLVLTGSGNLKGTGNALANSITGNKGNNTLSGGAGNDVINGGAGADRMIGGEGNDTYVVDDRGDRVVERAGEGTDLVKASVTFKLSNEVENLVLTGRDAIAGTGNALANSITGNAGANTLRGGDGNDVLKGLGGNDKLIGEAGKDSLFGGAGADQFVFAAIADSTPGAAGRDIIEDFSQRQGDRINLRSIDADATTRGDQAFDFIGTDRFSKTAGELRFQKQGSDTLVQADIDGDGRADFAILVNGHIALTAGDFVL